MNIEQRILIVGAGLSGLSMARWCLREGAKAVTLVDTREAAINAAKAALPQANARCSALDQAFMQELEPQAVYLSPGLSPEQLQAVTAWCDTHHVAVNNELDLFMSGLERHCPEHGQAPRVLAITGTNGKTTVTALTTFLLRSVGVEAVSAGNIAPAMLDALGAELDQQRWPQAWVLELSSFQLHASHGFEPTIGTLLNISDDHLDWHPTRAHYIEAKSKVWGVAAQRLLNRDDAEVMAFKPADPPAKNRRRKDAEPMPPAWYSFGLDVPTRAGDWGVESVNGMAWLVRAKGIDTGATDPYADEDIYIQRLMPAEALRIRGQHNWGNALAALALAHAVSQDTAGMLHALREYAGEPHRVQPIGVIAGVEYFDDSKGTNVGATLAALNGLGSERRLVVILGGQGKGQDFSPLRQPLLRCARGVVVFGQDANVIVQTLEGTALTIARADSMASAVREAALLAQSGDAVLLSPACASLDMFRNYSERGQAFTQQVLAMAEEAGGPL
jgi:UDP-N-acetylmuramoylalanine--D-glutamate ligase